MIVWIIHNYLFGLFQKNWLQISWTMRVLTRALPSWVWHFSTANFFSRAGFDWRLIQKLYHGICHDPMYSVHVLNIWLGYGNVIRARWNSRAIWSLCALTLSLIAILPPYISLSSSQFLPNLSIHVTTSPTSPIFFSPISHPSSQLDPALAHSCNFIHPVLYHYKQLPGPVPVRGKKLTR